VKKQATNAQLIPLQARFAQLIVYYFHTHLCILGQFGLTLLFIHGAGASPAVWRLQLRQFKDSAAIELPGHPNGQSLGSVEDYARIVSDYVTEHSVQQPVLVGHSMGGAIAIEYATAYNNLHALVLIGTGARLRVRPEFLLKIKNDYGEAAKLIASWSVSPKSDPILAQRLANDLLRVMPEVAYGDFSACDKFDRMNDLGRIRCRTLIICGVDDRMTPAKYSEYLHENIKGSELVLIPDAGHSVMLEKHREFNQALEAFLASL
jgi:pimeloyl-ACP methyl ester carboxylesterase